VHVYEFEGNADVLQKTICWTHKIKLAKLLLPREEVRRGILATRWLKGWSNRKHDYSLKREIRLYEDGCLLGCNAVQSGRSSLTFQGSVQWVLITLMMEAARTPETLVNFYQTTTTQKTAIFVLTAVRTSNRNQIIRVQMKNFGVWMKMNRWGKWFKFLFISYLNYIFFSNIPFCILF
jgi:hypothetical protein